MKAVYVTSDGKQFENKAEAKKYEATLKSDAEKRATTQGLFDFLTAALPDAPEAVEDMIAAVEADPHGFREAVAPLVAKARRKRSDAGVPRGPRRRSEAFAA